MKRCIFSPSLPQIKQANLDKDHFAMQTRLNLRKQLFVKTNKFLIKTKIFIVNKSVKEFHAKRYVVFMAYVDQ